MKPLKQRFEEKVDKSSSTTGCWLWTGARSRGGYGQINLCGKTKKTVRVHRLAWEFANGPIPPGKLVMHSCDVPHCVNPAHLNLGTPQQNMADKVAKGRQARNTGPKLSRAQVLAIRADPRTQRELAALYGVSDLAICNIRRGFTHAGVR